jgi:streptomycin 6-kinase
MFQVPAVLAECASRDRGAEGRNWIRQLPEIITAAQHRWSFGLGAVLPLGRELSVLIAVTMPGNRPAVLKASYPDAGPQHEAAALARWAGHGAAALLGADPGRGLLLLEHLAADRSLLAEDDARVLLIAARILQQLWVPPHQEDSLPEAADLARRWHTLIPGRYRALGRPFEPGLACAAVAASRDLAQGPRKPVLLHGDFHRGNVLASIRASWLAIDPCPLTGDAEFDIADLTADLLDEHIGQPAARSRLNTTLSGLCQAIPHLNRRRVLHWMLAKRISLAMDSLAATGNGDWDLAFARLLLNLQDDQLSVAPLGGRRRGPPGSRGPLLPGQWCECCSIFRGQTSCHLISLVRGSTCSNRRRRRSRVEVDGSVEYRPMPGSAEARGGYGEHERDGLAEDGRAGGGDRIVPGCRGQP